MLHDDIVAIAAMLKGCRTRRHVEERWPPLRERLDGVVAAMRRLPPARRPRVDGALTWLRDGATDEAAPLTDAQRAAIIEAADELSRLASTRRIIPRGRR